MGSACGARDRSAGRDGATGAARAHFG